MDFSELRDRPWGARRALVTGGGSGLGLGIVGHLSDAGARVLATDIDPASAERVAAAGGRFARADVADADDWTHVTAEAERRLDGLDLVVLNAGIPLLEPDPVTAPYDRVRHLWGVNLEGVAHGIRACVPALERAGGGDVVVVSSLAGLMAYPDDPYYAMTKHAVIGLARSSAATLAERGIRISVFCPGVVDTPLVPDHVRRAVLDAGLELLSPAGSAAHLAAALREEGSGRIWISQAHRGLEEHVPAPVRLPRPPRTGERD